MQLQGLFQTSSQTPVCYLPEGWLLSLGLLKRLTNWVFHWATHCASMRQLKDLYELEVGGQENADVRPLKVESKDQPFFFPSEVILGGWCFFFYFSADFWNHFFAFALLLEFVVGKFPWLDVFPCWGGVSDFCCLSSRVTIFCSLFFSSLKIFKTALQSLVVFLWDDHRWFLLWHHPAITSSVRRNQWRGSFLVVSWCFQDQANKWGSKLLPHPREHPKHVEKKDQGGKRFWKGTLSFDP